MIGCATMTNLAHLHARNAALNVLTLITSEGQPMDYALEQAFKNDQKLDARDKAFLRQLVTTTLRRLQLIDWALDRAMKNPLGKKDARTRNYLRLGAAQLLFMGVENFAAVDTTVTMIARDRHRGVQAKKNMANAVLRRIIREQDQIVAKIESFPLGHLPKWLRNRWLATYGEEVASAIARVQMNEPPLDLTIRPGESADEWAKKLGGQAIGGATVRLQKTGDIRKLEGFKEGKWWVQDIAASLPVRLMGNLAGLNVADLCAAPGGKTMQMAAMGAKVIALDRSSHRLKRLGENLGRTGLEATIIAKDVFKWTPDAPLDAILLDAPCSATGTMRRSPDVPFGKTLRQIGELAEIQEKMLARAFDWLRPGGTLVYCTCSLEPEEGEMPVAKFLEDNKSATRLPVRADEIGIDAPMITNAGDVRTLPCYLGPMGGMDGFFIARLSKTN
jgi:16S rRNA (cytosine967-C5)-methyltransferase